MAFIHAVFAALVAVSAFANPIVDLFTTDEAEVFNTYAFPDQANPGSFVLDAKGVVYKEFPNPTFITRLPFKILYDGALTPEDKARVDERLKPFLADGRGGREIQLSLEESGQVLTFSAKTPSDGSFEQNFNVAGAYAKDGDLLHLKTLFKLRKGKEFTGRAAVLGAEGFSVVSDIDDTVKISEVLDTKKTASDTFVLPFRPVPGMPALYNRLADKLSLASGASTGFHYVTGSPSQLNHPIQTFLDDEKFPFGSLDETRLVFTDISSLLKLSETLEYKVERITKIMRRFPQRKFVFIGDSTQKDPEAYAAVSTAFGNRQTACIWIRQVEGVNLEKEATLNAPARFETTFKDIPKNKWFVFRDPAELWELNPANGECRPGSPLVEQL